MKEELRGLHFASQPEKSDYNQNFKDFVSSVYSEKYLGETPCHGVFELTKREKFIGVT
jgi:hypothetical protein